MVELYPYAMLTRRVIEPAAGEDCEASVWVHASDYPQITVAVNFEAAAVEDLDGAGGELDVASWMDAIVFWPFHVVTVENAAEASEGAPLLVEHPEIDHVYMEGRVTWSELDDRVSRLHFTSLCWLVEPYTGNHDLDCQSFHEAWIEFSCDQAATEAGPVGVASWVTGPSGETLCVEPE